MYMNNNRLEESNMNNNRNYTELLGSLPILVIPFQRPYLSFINHAKLKLIHNSLEILILLINKNKYF